MNVTVRPVEVPADWVLRDCANRGCSSLVWVVPNPNVVPVCSSSCAKVILDHLMIGEASY